MKNPIQAAIDEFDKFYELYAAIDEAALLKEYAKRVKRCTKLQYAKRFNEAEFDAAEEAMNSMYVMLAAMKLMP
jgi:hypothetical protein